MRLNLLAVAQVVGCFVHENNFKGNFMDPGPLHTTCLTKLRMKGQRSITWPGMKTSTTRFIILRREISEKKVFEEKLSGEFNPLIYCL